MTRTRSTLLGLGMSETTGPAVYLSTAPSVPTVPAWLFWTWRIAAVAGAGTGAYHGWKRTGKVWPAVGYSLLGGVLPVVGIPVMFAQGFAKKKKKGR